MFWFWLQPVRYLAHALIDENSPRQLAFGFAVGMLVGLVPKGNLIAVALMTVLCAARINLMAGTLSAFLFSWVGLFTDPISHRIGLWLLQWESLVPTWTYLYDLPVLPWTRFNNTVVLGSLVLGLVLFYPAYRLSRPPFARYTPVLAEKISRYKMAQLLWGAEWAGKLRSA